MAHARAGRLLELLVYLHTSSRFTAAGMAERLGVSRRTVLRDVQELERLGVAIESMPGPGGGYRIPFGRRRLSMSFTIDEAVALVAGYEALSAHHVTPLSELSQHGITKIQAALPAQKADQLAKWRAHLSLRSPQRRLSLPYLDQLFEAAIEGHRLRIVYETVDAPAREMQIDPVGLYAEHGYWYCACRNRGRDIALRADRVLSITATLPFRCPPEALSDWSARRALTTESRAIQFDVTGHGAKRHELAVLIERGNRERVEVDRWRVNSWIAADDIEYWADKFVGVGSDARLQWPQCLVDAVRERIDLLAATYR